VAFISIDQLYHCISFTKWADPLDALAKQMIPHSTYQLHQPYQLYQFYINHTNYINCIKSNSYIPTSLLDSTPLWALHQALGAAQWQRSLTLALAVRLDAVGFNAVPWNVAVAILKMAIEIVDLPIKNGDFP
jgi:hypothetical protein